jgi:CBS domain-containing protein
MSVIMSDNDKMQDSNEIMQPQLRFLQQHCANDVVHFCASKVTGPLTLPSTATVSDALRFFRLQHIRSAPVIDAAYTGRDSVIGIVSYFDLIAAIISDPHVQDAIVRPNKTAEERYKLLAALPHFSRPVIELIGSSADSRGVWAFKADSTLLHICKSVEQYHFHQFLIFDEFDEMFMLTLSDVARYLLAHVNDIGMISNRSIQSLGAGIITASTQDLQKERLTHDSIGLLGLYVAFMTSDETAATGFRRMYRALASTGVPRGYEHLSAIAIVSPHTRKLVGTLTTTDIRVIDQYNLDLLLLPVTQYLERVEQIASEAPPRPLNIPSWTSVVTCRPSDSLQLVMKRMLDGAVHRIWVCDDQGDLQGVVSYADCVSALVQSVKIEQ